MSIKCPDSGIQVGSVLPKEPIYCLGLASDANFICAVARLLKSSVYIINQIRDLTNSYDMPGSRSQRLFLEKTLSLLYILHSWIDFDLTSHKCEV